MGTTTNSMQAQDNLRECRLYGAKQPSGGRTATEDELSNIRQWIHSVELVEEFLDGSNEANDTENKIVIDLIHGPRQPFFVQITPLADDKIHFMDASGGVRILKQPELRAFLDRL